MDQFRCTQVIQGPNDGESFEVQSKTNFVTEWVANGTINGQPVMNVNIRSVWQSPKKQMFYINAMNNGEQMDCVSDDHNGVVRWKIKKPYAEQGGGQPQQQHNPPQQHNQAPQQQQGAQQAPAQRQAPQGASQHKAIPFDASHRLMDLCEQEARRVKMSEPNIDLYAGALFTACLAGQVAFPNTKAEGNNENMEQHFEDETVKAIGATGLAELFDACEGMDLAKAVTLYRAANGDAAAFAQALNAAIQALTPVKQPDAGEDRLPF